MTTPTARASVLTRPSPGSRLLAGAAAVVLVLSGCGTEAAPGSGTEVNASIAPTPVSDPTGNTETTGPEATDPVPPEDEDSTGIGTVVVNTRLPVVAADYPGEPIPTSSEVADAEELGELYGAVAGIDEVVAAVQEAAPPAERRLFVYVVTACVVDDVALKLSGNELRMVVKGNTTLRCEPPPLQMVVWSVGADEVPADVVTAQAIQS